MNKSVLLASFALALLLVTGRGLAVADTSTTSIAYQVIDREQKVSFYGKRLVEVVQHGDQMIRRTILS